MVPGKGWRYLVSGGGGLTKPGTFIFNDGTFLFRLRVGAFALHLHFGPRSFLLELVVAQRI